MEVNAGSPGLKQVRAAAVIASLVVFAALGGCGAASSLVGGMAESYMRNSTRSVPAEYDGLAGKSFAVVVLADRIIQSDFPDIVGQLTVTIAERLKEHAGASGYVPGPSVLQFQLNRPRWVTMTYEELARELGVERLVVVELQEFRLNDPGNQYIWAGVASGSVGVVEADGPVSNLMSFQKNVQVKFPDADGYGPMQMPARAVQVTLAQRFVDRASWLLYAHEEPYYPDY